MYFIVIANRHHGKTKVQMFVYMVHEEECVILQRDGWERWSLKANVWVNSFKREDFFSAKVRS